MDTEDLRRKIKKTLRFHEPPAHVDPQGLPADEFDCCADAVMDVIAPLIEECEAWRALAEAKGIGS